MKLLCSDVSDNNPPVDVDKYAAAGFPILIAKVSESDSYYWPGSATLSTAFHKAGMGGLFGHYHFGDQGAKGSVTPAEEARWFFDHVLSAIGPGDFFVYDAEKNGVTAVRVRGFIDELHLLVYSGVTRQHRLAQRAFKRSLIYGSPAFLIAQKIASYRGWKLWQAQYNSTASPVPGFSGGWTLWQNTDSASVPGIGGRSDQSKVKPRFVLHDVHPGDRTVAVYELSLALHRAGYRGFVLNSSYGRGKQRAVKKFKKKQGWKPTPVVGARMWRKLFGL